MRKFTQLIGVGLVLLLSITPMQAEDFDVKFVRFELDQVGKTVMVKWGTESELNNQFFTVQRSTDSFSWSDLEDVDAIGSTPGSGDYAFNDTDVQNGWNYYRVKQTDIDGSFSYSDIKKIMVEIFDENDIAVTPNPIGGDVFTVQTDGLIGNPDVELINIAGQQLKISTVQNDTDIKVSAANIVPGLYFLILRFGNDQQVVKKINFN